MVSGTGCFHLVVYTLRVVVHGFWVVVLVHGFRVVVLVQGFRVALVVRLVTIGRFVVVVVVAQGFLGGLSCRIGCLGGMGANSPGA